MAYDIVMPNDLFFFPILGTHIVGCAFVCVLSFLISLVFIIYTRVCSVSTLYN